MGTHPRGLFHLQGPHIESTRSASYIFSEISEGDIQACQVRPKCQLSRSIAATVLKHYTAYHPHRNADRLSNQKDEQHSRSTCPHMWESVKEEPAVHKILPPEPLSVKTVDNIVIRPCTFKLVTTGDSQIFGTNVIPETVKIPKMIQQPVRKVRFRQGSGTIHGTVLHLEDTQPLEVTQCNEQKISCPPRESVHNSLDGRPYWTSSYLTHP
jgi:hypothetical protein